MSITLSSTRLGLGALPNILKNTLGSRINPKTQTMSRLGRILLAIEVPAEIPPGNLNAENRLLERSLYNNPANGTTHTKRLFSKYLGNVTPVESKDQAHPCCSSCPTPSPRIQRNFPRGMAATYTFFRCKYLNVPLAPRPHVIGTSIRLTALWCFV